MWVSPFFFFFLIHVHVDFRKFHILDQMLRTKRLLFLLISKKKNFHILQILQVCAWTIIEVVFPGLKYSMLKKRNLFFNLSYILLNLPQYGNNNTTAAVTAVITPGSRGLQTSFTWSKLLRCIVFP